MRFIRGIIGAATLLMLTSAPARAEGFITPFIGYNFGGDSGNCRSLTDCQEKRTNIGVSIGRTGTPVGFESDFSFATNFFGDAPDSKNSVFTAMGNLLVGIGVGPVRPYVVGGVGLIRPHVSAFSIDSDKNAFGYDIGGGVSGYLSPHIGLRGDIRHFHTLQDVDVLIFTGEKLAFWRASVGLVLKF